MQLILISVIVLASSMGLELQDENDSSPDADVVELVQELARLTRTRPGTDTDAIIEQLKKRLSLADQILEHPDTDEDQRVFAALATLQTYGFHYAIIHRETIKDEDLIQNYAKAIENFIEDSDDRVVLEATTANASLSVGRYIDESNENMAKKTAEAMTKLNEIAPKDPLIQTTRRVLLERIWNSEKPELLLQKLADSGDEPSQIAIEQIKNDSDKEQAEFLWDKHFARFNDFVAMQRLASSYEAGKGTKVNNAQAARWYTKLSRLGDLNSQIKLGDFHLEGKGYSKNPATALEYYQTAARAGSRVAQFKLGECYRQGLGAEQSDDNWRKWIKSAAFNATVVEVQKLYETINFQSAPDSFQVFYEALVEQNPDDHFYLNNFAYSLLIGTKKDPQRALELINEALENAPPEFTGLDNFKDTKAQALKQLQRWDEAANLFEAILEDSKQKESVLEALIECYDNIDKEKADEYRQQLEDLADKL